tara:strand:- start:2903 stop:3742 length:840 start_codon:yes stop_codon:yes gene_type:complete
MKKILIIVIAFSLTGCEISEDEIRDTSFADTIIVPSSIVIDTQISTDNSGRVLITPSAEGTSLFYVDKGDESPVDEISIGGSVENFYNTGDYTISVTAESATGEQLTLTKEIFVLSTCIVDESDNVNSEAGPLLIDIENKFNSLFTNLGGISSLPETNPKHDLNNTTCTVEKVSMNSGCSSFAGLLLTFPNDYQINETSNLFSMSVLSLEISVDVSVFFIGSQNYELQQTVKNFNQWETLNFDLSPYDGETLKRIILYFNKGEPCDDSVYYFDQIELKS